MSKHATAHIHKRYAQTEMRNFKLTFVFIFLSILCFNETHGQNELSKTNWDKLIVGKWVNKVNKTIDGKEVAMKCNDTIQYFENGNYASQECDWNETGKWKFSENKDLIIHYEIENAYWKRELETDKLFSSEGPILSVRETELITVTYGELEGEIHCYYTKLE